MPEIWPSGGAQQLNHSSRWRFDKMADTRFKLVVIRTGDPERLVQFYRLLGMDFTRERHGEGPVHFSPSPADMLFEIYPLKQNQVADAGTRLGFSVPNLQAVLDALRTRDQTTPEAKESPWGLRTVVRDPDGRTVELYEG